MKANKIYISGNVQGVFFRAFVKENAEKLGLKGYVRNLENGRVEVFVEGNADKVDKLIELCKQGPKHAKVRNVDVLDEKVQGRKDFRTLHI